MIGRRAGRSPESQVGRPRPDRDAAHRRRPDARRRAASSARWSSTPAPSASWRSTSDDRVLLVQQYRHPVAAHAVGAAGRAARRRGRGPLGADRAARAVRGGRLPAPRLAVLLDVFTSPGVCDEAAPLLPGPRSDAGRRGRARYVAAGRGGGHDRATGSRWPRLVAAVLGWRAAQPRRWSWGSWPRARPTAAGSAALRSRGCAVAGDVRNRLSSDPDGASDPRHSSDGGVAAGDGRTAAP